MTTTTMTTTSTSDIKPKCNSNFHATHCNRSAKPQNEKIRYQVKWMCRCWILLKQCHFESWLIGCGWRSQLCVQRAKYRLRICDCVLHAPHSVHTYGFVSLFIYKILIQYFCCCCCRCYSCFIGFKSLPRLKQRTRNSLVSIVFKTIRSCSSSFALEVEVDFMNNSDIRTKYILHYACGCLSTSFCKSTKMR